MRQEGDSRAVPLWLFRGPTLSRKLPAMGAQVVDEVLDRLSKEEDGLPLGSGMTRLTT